MSQRLNFGVFLAPHHPIGEHPTLQFQRDLELATWRGNGRSKPSLNQL